MKITYLIDSLRSGGKERQLIYLVKRLSKIYDIQLFILSNEIFYNEIYDLAIEYHIISKEKRFKYNTIFFIYRELIKFKPDVIHSWADIASILVLPYLLTHPTVALISSIRYAGVLNKTYKVKLVMRLSFFLSNQIISNSKKGLEVENLQNDSKGMFIHNGIDILEFDRQSSQEFEYNLVLKKYSKNIVMVASFTDAKDYITFIKAAKNILRENKDICFICIGDGPNKKEVEREAEEYKNKNILFLGTIKKIPALLKQVDIGILLSNTNGHAEGISNAIMEYMSASLPVIATNAGGNPEIVKDGESGFLVPAFDVDAVSNKLKFLINNPNIAENMGKKGRKIIEAEFSMEKMINQYVNLYNKLCKN